MKKNLLKALLITIGLALALSFTACGERKCTLCEGNGKCPRCLGSGHNGLQTCYECAGSGICPQCHGSGEK